MFIFLIPVRYSRHLNTQYMVLHRLFESNLKTILSMITINCHLIACVTFLFLLKRKAISTNKKHELENTWMRLSLRNTLGIFRYFMKFKLASLKNTFFLFFYSLIWKSAQEYLETEWDSYYSIMALPRNQPYHKKQNSPRAPQTQLTWATVASRGLREHKSFKPAIHKPVIAVVFVT